MTPLSSRDSSHKEEASIPLLDLLLLLFSLLFLLEKGSSPSSTAELKTALSFSPRVI